MLLWHSDFGSVVTLPLGALALFSRRHRNILLVLLAFVVFNVVAWWLLTHRIDRFLVPLLPVIALLAALGATLKNNIIWRRGVSAFLVCGSLFNLAFAAGPVPGDNRFLTSYEALRLGLPGASPLSIPQLHPAHLFLNSASTSKSVVMMVGEAQVFDLEMPVVYNTCFDDCVFEKLSKGKTHEERVLELQHRHISHIFFYWRELKRYRSPGNYGYSEYVTQTLVQREFVDTGILREIPLEVDPNNSQLFEVIGWQDWNNEHNTESPRP